MAGTNKTFINNNFPQCEDDDLNGFNREINNSIERAGIPLNYTDRLQVAQAMATMASNGDAYELDVSSTANALVLNPLTIIPTKPRIAPDAYQPQMRFRFKALATNTGAMVAQVGLLPALPITVGGVATPANSVIAGRIYTLEYDAGNLILDTSSASVGVSVIPLAADITVTVGSGGDFATINEALDYLTRTYQPVYKFAGVTATVNLLAGFVMAEQIYVHGLDLGWITITGVDAVTVVTRSAISVSAKNNVLTTELLVGAPVLTPLFEVDGGGTLPVLDQKFNIDTTGSNANANCGVLVVGAASSATIKATAGVSGWFVAGCLVYMGVCVCRGAVFTSVVPHYSNACALRATYGAQVDGSGGTFWTGVQGSALSNSYGLLCTYGAQLTAINAFATGVLCTYLSKVNVLGTNCRRGAANGTGSNADILILAGSFVYKSGTTLGGTNPATLNNLTAEGVIFG